jgi:hypothetical protein
MIYDKLYILLIFFINLHFNSKSIMATTTTTTTITMAIIMITTNFQQVVIKDQYHIFYFLSYN